MFGKSETIEQYRARRHQHYLNAKSKNGWIDRARQYRKNSDANFIEKYGLCEFMRVQQERRAHRNAWNREYKKRNYEKVLSREKEYQKIVRARLDKRYVAQLLRIKTQDLPESMFLAMKEYILNIRLLSAIHKEIGYDKDY